MSHSTTKSTLNSLQQYHHVHLSEEFFMQHLFGYVSRKIFFTDVRFIV